VQKYCHQSCSFDSNTKSSFNWGVDLDLTGELTAFPQSPSWFGDWAFRVRKGKRRKRERKAGSGRERKGTEREMERERGGKKKGKGEEKGRKREEKENSRGRGVPTLLFYKLATEHDVYIQLHYNSQSTLYL